MSRRLTILVVVTAVLAAAYPVAVQSADKMYRIGTLASSTIRPAFGQELRKLGYVEGANLTFLHRRARRIEQYPGLAQELVRLNVDLILPDLAGKRLEILKETFPSLSRIAHLSPGSSPGGPDHLNAMPAAARAMGVQVQALTVGSPDDLEDAFRAAVDGGAEALIVVGVSFFIPHRQRIVDLGIKHRLPTMHTHLNWVPLGGLMSYTTDANARYRQAAHYVDKISHGAAPADLPVERPTKFVLEVNIKTARAFGITIPPSALRRADRVVE